MSALLIFAIISINCVFQGRILFTVAEETCDSHYDCDLKLVCCKSVPQAPYKNVSNTKRCQPNLHTDAAYRSRYKSCFGYNCSSDDDCSGRRYGKKLCCQENVCRVCPSCEYNSDCGPSKYCCTKSLYRNYHQYTIPFYVYTRCGSSCLGEYCTSYADCGNDCCRSGKCVECSGDCKSDSECRPGQYCCGNDNQRFWKARGKCKDSCIGDFCYINRDCGGYGECCKSNKCFKCPICQANSQCESGKYCCTARSFENAACDTSCLGYECYSDHHCGPPDECCISNKCVKCGNLCSSNSHCSNGAICCKGLSFLDNSKCASNCIGKSCVSRSDCNQSGIWCDQGKCSRTKTCKSTSDCGVMNNEQYYCCIIERSESSTPVMDSERKMCEYSCIYHPCSSNNDCVEPDQCCSSENICIYKEFNECPARNAFPTWGIVGLIIGMLLIVAVPVIVCLCYRSHKRKQQRAMLRASDQDSCNNSRNTSNNGNLQLESSGSSYLQEHSFPLPPIEATHNQPHATSNEVTGIELVSNAVNGLQGRDEPNGHPPTYSLNDPLAPPYHEVHPETMENPNMPPPPYSLNYYYFRNDPPPNYEE